MNFRDKFDGTIRWDNIGLFLLYTTNYVSFSVLAMMAFYFAVQANVNTGAITTIWSITPLFIAFLDHFIIGIKLKMRHLFSMICLFLCTISISISSLI